MTVAEKPCRFWMVYGMDRGVPTKRHHTVEAARAEANRLSRVNPGVQFYVFGSEYAVETATKRVHEFDGKNFIDITDDIPF
ncbi:hypothetical protein [Methylobacterium nonmethylotrophicum]|uniref:Uncharacterized protein n=1 Tax=Methylobacterium nonmethylotrophicum TaxID=1141884 RepID=A0A4Z0NPE4_9HYPH|nr:hypothetical protein [Methylobacterium nonmethylotrophicum]TGD98088.1 hypothetical protein EU555_18255 [Methylobacterium nonmethylotrophicum]